MRSQCRQSTIAFSRIHRIADSMLFGRIRRKGFKMIQTPNRPPYQLGIANNLKAFQRDRLHQRTTLALAAFTAFLAHVLNTAPIEAATNECPNFVLILADDQSYRDFGFMGNNLVHTPNLDRLAKQSARYPNGYVSMSVCRPALATFLTGLYPHQSGIHFNHPPPGLSTMRNMTAKQYRKTRASSDHLIRDIPTLPRTPCRTRLRMPTNRQALGGRLS